MINKVGVYYPQSEERIGKIIGLGELMARETLSMVQLTLKLLQRTRQISTMGDRILMGVGERRWYMYHPRTEVKIPTPTPTAVDSNTLPQNPQVKGFTTKEKRRGLNDGPSVLRAGMVVVR